MMEKDKEIVRCIYCGGYDTVCTDYEPADVDCPAMEFWECNTCATEWNRACLTR
jgi:hypothetical protein